MSKRQYRQPSSRDVSTSVKGDGEKAFDKTNCILEKDLPNCCRQPCKRELPPKKVDINFPYLQRKGTFYKKWTDHEKQTFEGLYKRLSRSKDRCHIFRRIATKLPLKTIGECIKYYYLFKNITTFKVRSKQKQKRKRRMLVSFTKQQRQDNAY